MRQDVEAVKAEIAKEAAALGKLNKPELEAKAKDLGLSAEGTKAEIVARIAEQNVVARLAALPAPAKEDPPAPTPAPAPAKAGRYFKTVKPGVRFVDLSLGIEITNQPTRVDRPRRSARLTSTIKTGAVVEVPAPEAAPNADAV